MSKTLTRKRGPEGATVAVLGADVRELRIGAGLTQRGLATLATISDRTVSAIETGKRGASLPVLDRLARALGVESATLRKPERRAA